MQIIEDTALRMSVPTPVLQEALKDLTRSEQLGNDLVLCWDFFEAQYLTDRLDRLQPDPVLPDIPSPMLRDYNWPGIYIPFAHQKHTASFLSLRRRAFCFNEAGTGKTSAAIWAADYLMKLGLVKRVLVICPVTIMHSAWQADIFNTAMHRTSGIAYGSKKKRLKVLANNDDFVITNYEGVGVMRKELEAARFDLIIVDEANAYKEVSTVRWRQLAKLVLPSTRMWMMTGTPAAQSPLDAYGLAKFISPERVPKFKTYWRDRVMMQATRFKWVPKSYAQGEVFRALQPAIRYTKAECLDLPPIMYQTREVPLTPSVYNYYKQMVTQMVMEAAGEQVTAVNAAARLNKLLQISGGAVYTDDRDVIEFDVSPRLNALMEVLDETTNKVIVFVPYTHTIKVVTEYLRSQQVSAEIIDGSVTVRERARIIGSFQSEKDPRVLVIQPKAASHGVTLTAADTVVFWSPVMSVETYLQCISRIDRVGQKNSMTVVSLEGSAAERIRYSALRSQVSYHNELVDIYNAVIKESISGSC